jgi:hypothetical protein
VFRAANFKQRVFKNKKCQSFFSQTDHFFSNLLFFHLKTRYLRSFYTKNNFKQMGAATESDKFIGHLFGKLTWPCQGFSEKFNSIGK